MKNGLLIKLPKEFGIINSYIGNNIYDYKILMKSLKNREKLSIKLHLKDIQIK